MANTIALLIEIRDGPKAVRKKPYGSTQTISQLSLCNHTQNIISTVGTTQIVFLCTQPNHLSGFARDEGSVHSLYTVPVTRKNPMMYCHRVSEKYDKDRISRGEQSDVKWLVP